VEFDHFQRIQKSPPNRDQPLNFGKNLTEHPDHRVIVLTHSYLSANKQRIRDGGMKIKGNHGEQMWQKFVRKHKNISMVLCGHVAGEAVLTSTPALDKFRNGPSSRFDLAYPMEVPSWTVTGITRPDATIDVKTEAEQTPADGLQKVASED
jgi:hypothetical protein